MRQLDLFSALQSNTEGIDTEFKSRSVAWSTCRAAPLFLGVAEKPTGLVWDRHFLVNQLYPAHPSARVRAFEVANCDIKLTAVSPQALAGR